MPSISEICVLLDGGAVVISEGIFCSWNEQNNAGSHIYIVCLSTSDYTSLRIELCCDQMNPHSMQMVVCQAFRWELLLTEDRTL